MLFIGFIVPKNTLDLTLYVSAVRPIWIATDRMNLQSIAKIAKVQFGRAFAILAS